MPDLDKWLDTIERQQAEIEQLRAQLAQEAAEHNAMVERMAAEIERLRSTSGE